MEEEPENVITDRKMNCQFKTSNADLATGCPGVSNTYIFLLLILVVVIVICQNFIGLWCLRRTKETYLNAFELVMLRKLTELVETIADQKLEMTNQQKTFIQKQDQMEGKIKQLLDEQRNMNKQEKVLRCERKIY